MSPTEGAILREQLEYLIAYSRAESVRLARVRAILLEPHVSVIYKSRRKRVLKKRARAL